MPSIWPRRPSRAAGAKDSTDQWNEVARQILAVGRIRLWEGAFALAVRPLVAMRRLLMTRRPWLSRIANRVQRSRTQAWRPNAVRLWLETLETRANPTTFEVSDPGDDPTHHHTL